MDRKEFERLMRERFANDSLGQKALDFLLEFESAAKDKSRLDSMSKVSALVFMSIMHFIPSSKRTEAAAFFISLLESMEKEVNGDDISKHVIPSVIKSEGLIHESGLNSKVDDVMKVVMKRMAGAGSLDAKSVSDIVSEELKKAGITDGVGFAVLNVDNIKRVSCVKRVVRKSDEPENGEDSGD